MTDRQREIARYKEEMARAKDGCEGIASIMAAAAGAFCHPEIPMFNLSVFTENFGPFDKESLREKLFICVYKMVGEVWELVMENENLPERLDFINSDDEKNSGVQATEWLTENPSA